MNEHRQRLAGDLAHATRDWIVDADPERARQCRALLRSCAPETHAALLKQTRVHYSRYRWHGSRLSWGAGVEPVLHRAVAAAPVECVEFALLATLSHPSGFLRQAATELLVGRGSHEAVTGLLFAADDHVLEVHVSATAGLKRTPAAVLARHPGPIMDDPPGERRSRWRADVIARLSDSDSHATLTALALEVTDGRALAALKLLDRLGTSCRPQVLMGAACWRVRRHVAVSGGEGVVTLALRDTHAAVRHAAVSAAARFTDSESRRCVMRLAVRDDALRVRRVAAWYLRDEPAVLAQVRAELDGASPRQQALALATLVTLAHPEAQALAEQALVSHSAAARHAAIDALFDLKVLGERHFALMSREMSPKVARRLAVLLVRTPGVSLAHLVGLLALEDLAGHPAAPRLIGLLHPWDAAPITLRAASEGWPGAKTLVAAQSVALARLGRKGWLAPSVAQRERIETAVAAYGEAAPELVAMLREVGGG